MELLHSLIIDNDPNTVASPILSIEQHEYQTIMGYVLNGSFIQDVGFLYHEIIAQLLTKSAILYHSEFASLYACFAFIIDNKLIWQILF